MKGRTLGVIVQGRRQQPAIAWPETPTDAVIAPSVAEGKDCSALGLDIMIRGKLQAALDALFRPVEQSGFWNREGYITRGLLCTLDSRGALLWREDTRLLHRYRGFALMGLGDWRCSSHGSDRFDSEIRSHLEWYKRFITSPRLLARIPNYGAGAHLYGLATLEPFIPQEPVTDLLTHHLTRRVAFGHHEDALVIMGLARRWGGLGQTEKQTVRHAVDRLLTSQADNGLFQLPAAPRLSTKHQNTMYICWALGEYGLRERTEQVCKAISKALEFTVARRMRTDGGILWHEGGDLLHRCGNWCRRAILRQTIDVEKLYECHQTFFVVAVDYLCRLGDSSFSDHATLALEWIYRSNARKQDLCELTGIGVPWRAISLTGEWRLPGDMFKGVYELGAYVRALSAPERETASL